MSFGFAPIDPFGRLTRRVRLWGSRETVMLEIALVVNVFFSVALGVFYTASVWSQKITPVPAVAQHVHRILFHVGSDNATVMSHAISAADNAEKFYQARGEPVAIEVVANGGGVRMMRADTSPVAPSIAYLHKTYPAIVLSACGTTLRLMTAREGKEPSLLDGVRVTPAGIARITELEEAGWSYVSP